MLVRVPRFVQAIDPSWVCRLCGIVALNAVLLVELGVLSDVLDVNRGFWSYRRASSFILQACRIVKGASERSRSRSQAASQTCKVSLRRGHVYVSRSRSLQEL